MRHLLSQILLIAAFATSAWPCWAIPVYLHPGSRFPSGHHTRKELENRTHKVQFQQWVRIQTDDLASFGDHGAGKIYGWLPEEHLVTAIRLATEADVSEATPLRYEMQMEAIESTILPKGTHVLILDVQGSWARTQSLPPAIRTETWIPTSILRASLKISGTMKVFVPAITPVFVLPGIHARVLTRLQGPTYLTASVKSKGWFEVILNGEKGYVRSSDTVTLADLGVEGARSLTDDETLRSAPLPYADLIRALSPMTRLKVIERQDLRWGSAKVPDVGEIWWPMSTESDDEKFGGPHEKLSTPDLFQRKIFAMASSPAIPSLKFISAEGIFRTVDGEEWSRIPLFENKNYPIAVASSGSVFVGPYISDDHGETFQQWIRWDSLVATLRRRSSASTTGLRILEIHPQDPSGRRVMLKLNTGTKDFVRLVTTDQGLSWRTQ
jgi:hypothetical protein